MNYWLNIFLLFCYSNVFTQIPKQNPNSYKVHELTAYSIKISFSKVMFATSYLVIRTNNSTMVKPLKGKKYERGDTIGDAKVIQSKADTLINPRAVRANTTYNFVIYACYQVNEELKYILEKPLKINITTVGLSHLEYYESISVTAPNFVTTLSSLLTQHTVIPYASYKNTVLSMLEIQDTIAGRSFLQCVYSGERKIVEMPFDWTKAGYSREHTYAHSWMPTHPADNPPVPEFSDLHNLYPTNLEKANTVRNNFPLGEVTGKILYTYLQGKLGYDDSQIVYEPRDSHKGNAARAMMYMSIAYNSQNSHNWSFPSVQSQEIIKKWHFQDPPDNYEIARQEYIYWLQGNRNPFIDHPEYACYIDFSKLFKMKGTCSNSLNENTNEKLAIQCGNSLLRIVSEEIITQIVIYDASGKKLIHDFPYDFQFLKDGLFTESTFCILEIKLSGGEVTRRKLVVN
jgi:hypothetical protein